jgi:hypothetical protein
MKSIPCRFLFSSLLVLCAVLPADAFAGELLVARDIETLEQRVQVLSDLCRGLKNSYAGWELKKRVRLGEGWLLDLQSPRAQDVVADGDAICAKAIEREKKILDPSPDRSEVGQFEIAKHNLRFQDRVRALGAAFKDSHFSITPATGATSILLGFQMIEIQGRFYVAKVFQFCRVGMAYCAQNPLEKGDEVLAIDGKEIEAARKGLYPYVHASSEAVMKSKALGALTSRDFHYPECAKVKIKVRSRKFGESEVELTWFANGPQNLDGDYKRELDRAFLGHVGIRPLKGVNYVEDTVNPGQYRKSGGLLGSLDDAEDRIGFAGVFDEGSVETLTNAAEDVVLRSGPLSRRR